MKVHRLAVTTALLTLALLVVGGLVHPTGSSLACPDWPLCFGEVLPEMTGGVLYEHSHRLLAGVVVLATLGLAAAVTASRRSRGTVLLAWGAVALVGVQALLGGLTVLLRLPTLVSTLHLATSMAFLLLLLHLAVRLAPGERGEVLPRAWVAVGVAAVFAQVVWGGLVRHLGASHACGSDPILCAGSAFPELAAARLHLGHRAFGVLVTLWLVGVSLGAFRRARAAGRRWTAAVALATPVVALLQVALGVVTVVTHVAVAPVAAHTGVAGLLLGAAFLTWEGLGRAPEGREQGRADDAASERAGAVSDAVRPEVARPDLEIEAAT